MIEQLKEEYSSLERQLKEVQAERGRKHLVKDIAPLDYTIQVIKAELERVGKELHSKKTAWGIKKKDFEKAYNTLEQQTMEWYQAALGEVERTLATFLEEYAQYREKEVELQGEFYTESRKAGTYDTLDRILPPKEVVANKILSQLKVKPKRVQSIPVSFDRTPMVDSTRIEPSTK